MGIGQKLKDTLHRDNASDNKHGSSNTPGIFPSDGFDQEYIPPRGTHVGQTGHESMTDQVRDELPGTSQHRQHEQNVGDRHVMDPADTKHGSNVMDTTGRSGDPMTTSSYSDSGRDQHSKLHKSNDPRRYEDSTTATDTTRTGGLLSSDTPRHQQGLTSDISGRYAQDTTGYGRDTTDDRSREHGVYNTVTGAGSREDSTRHHHQKDHSSTRPDTDIGLGQRDLTHRTHDQHQGNVGHARDTISDRYDDRTTGPGQAVSRDAGIAGTGAAVAGGATAYAAGRHHDNIRDDHRDRTNPIGTAHSNYDNDQLHKRSYDNQTIQSGSTTTDRFAQYDIGHPSAAGAPQSYTQPQSHQYQQAGSNYSHPNREESLRSQVQPQSQQYQQGVGPTTTGPSGLGGVTGAATTAATSGGVLEGHPNAKVMHACQHCGKDNDISRYFRKEAVLRFS